MHTEIIKEIEAILTEAKIDNFSDYVLKNDQSNPYYGIYVTEKMKKTYFYHLVSQNILQAVIRKNNLPEVIKRKYGLMGTRIASEGLAKHYYCNFPLENGKLNGKYTIQEKKDFFIDIARQR